MKLLWKMVCEDHQLLQRSGIGTRRLFLISGIIMCINYGFALLGMYQIFEIVFTNILIALFLALFVTMVFMNIYRLCLTTLQKEEKNLSFSYFLSLISRLIFVGFLGLILIKGFEIFIAFKGFKALDLQDYRGEILGSFNEIHTQFPSIWLATFCLVILFIIPFLLKVSLGAKNRYSLETLKLNDQIIKNDYLNFKKQYSLIFSDRFNMAIVYKEDFNDPPYNTIVKTEPKKIGGNDDFLKTIFAERNN